MIQDRAMPVRYSTCSVAWRITSGPMSGTSLRMYAICSGVGSVSSLGSVMVHLQSLDGHDLIVVWRIIPADQQPVTVRQDFADPAGFCPEDADEAGYPGTYGQ